MKLAAAHAIAGALSDLELGPDYIVPSVFDRGVADAVAAAVEGAALRTGVARLGTIRSTSTGPMKRADFAGWQPPS